MLLNKYIDINLSVSSIFQKSLLNILLINFCRHLLKQIRTLMSSWCCITFSCFLCKCILYMWFVFASFLWTNFQLKLSKVKMLEEISVLFWACVIGCMLKCAWIWVECQYSFHLLVSPTPSIVILTMGYKRIKIPSKLFFCIINQTNIILRVKKSLTCSFLCFLRCSINTSA
jgi:hypothetical protein